MAKTSCPVTHAQFEEAAKSGKVRIVGGPVMVGQSPLGIKVNDVKPDKSLGLYAFGKAMVEVELADGTKRVCPVQVGGNITLIGSKPE